MHPAAASMLACSHCGARLEEAGGSVRCRSGHSFDLARQGYVGMLAGRAPGGGDTAEMVAAREAFLAAGHFDPIAEALAEGAQRSLAGYDGPGGVLDAGGGTGWYLARVLDSLPERAGLCLDLSRYAARRAARSHRRAGAAVCDVWAGLPVRDGAAALVLSVFAPRNGPEFARALAPGGTALLVAPTGRHLRELREPLGMVAVDELKAERVPRAMEPLRGEPAAKLEYELRLDSEDTVRVAAMGPSAHHVEPAELRARASSVAGLPVTVSVEIRRFYA